MRTASWSDPDLHPPAAGALRTPLTYVAPTYLVSPVTAAHQLATTATGGDAGGGTGPLAPLTCDDSHPTVVSEGVPINGTVRVRVGRVDKPSGAFVALPGVVVLAVMHTAAGFVLPKLFHPELSAVRTRALKGSCTGLPRGASPPPAHKAATACLPSPCS